MWKEAAAEALPEVEFRAPVDATALAEAERRLGRGLPAQLTALLMETNGVVGAYGTDVVWSLDRIVEQNLLFWSPDTFPGLYMPFDPLLFFGDNGGGDQFAFVLAPERPDIFVWDHEDDSRLWAARELEDYLHRSLAGGGDWYR
ncbi:SMI1/KNR4 family protein [Streptomyces griseoluteus]|uniref:SMI1/KNR4 family protein n=1 Tax=Streptomyces griseoluteus TaxID=29306 RepID=A0A4Z1DJU1_STRGP|nr:SMI1/KNR4 family protein [Streptomyces griseoluteus]TGN83939.1 SMI1/KNR4 family protein [Streptomyces griseoluteus]GHF06515.1 SMI1/KNR4 family protein [Streptomyces griseoluteus]